MADGPGELFGNFGSAMPSGGAPMPDGFDPSWYLTQNPDVARDSFFGSNPLEHYLRHGRGEGRAPNASILEQMLGIMKKDERPSALLPPMWSPGSDAAGGDPWAAYLAAARRSTQAANALPYVLDPQSLSLNQAENKKTVFPGKPGGDEVTKASLLQQVLGQVR